MNIDIKKTFFKTVRPKKLENVKQLIIRRQQLWTQRQYHQSQIHNELCDFVTNKCLRPTPPLIRRPMTPPPIPQVILRPRDR